MEQYNELGKRILEEGVFIGKERTGTGTYKLFGAQMRFNLMDGFPLVAGSKKHLRGIFAELMMFLNGITNNNYLKVRGVTIWNEWALPEDVLVKVRRRLECIPDAIWDAIQDNEKNMLVDFSKYPKLQFSLDREEFVENFQVVVYEDGIEWARKLDVLEEEIIEIPEGELGPVYGKQWRNWKTSTGGSIDQIEELLKNLVERPFSRRHVISAWNPEFLPDESISPIENVKQKRMCLAPCHVMFQFDVRPMTYEERLKFAKEVLELDLGSKDSEQDLDELNVPKNKLSCLLMQRSADWAIGSPYNIASYSILTMLIARTLNFGYGDFVYSLGDVHVYSNHYDKFKEQLTREIRPLPKLKINRRDSIYDYEFSDLKLEGYNPHPVIVYPISV